MRISDLRDVPANAEYYSDLKVLIEQYGIIGNDLIVAREDTIAISTEPIGSLFYPKTKLTNRQFAFLFDASLGYLKDTIGGYKLPDSLDAVEKYALMQELRNSINRKPLNKINLTTSKEVTGLQMKFEESFAVASLVDRHRLGADLLNFNGEYARMRLYSEKEISDILANALQLKPICVKGKCNIGNLTLNYKNRTVERGRFVRLLNQYLEAYIAKLNSVINRK